MAAKTEAVPATETMVDVFVPKVSGEAPFQYVAVNGKAWGGHEALVQQDGLFFRFRAAFDGEAGEALQLAHEREHHNDAD